MSHLTVFMIGAYTDATVNGHETVSAQQWILTSMFGIMYFGMFIKSMIKSDR